MAYLKWRRNRPYVYQSDRVTEHTTNEAREVFETEKVKSQYLGSYRKYRENRPLGTFDSLIPSKKLLDMMTERPARFEILQTIDKEVYAEFQRTQAEKEL